MTRVLIADSSNFWRRGISSLLDALLPSVNVAEVETRLDLERYLKDNALPQLLLIGRGLKYLNRLDDLRRIHTSYPDLVFAVIGDYTDRETVFQLLHAGVNGAIPRDVSDEEFGVALRTIMSGHIYVPPMVMERTAEILPPANDVGNTPDSPALGNPPLTHRQREVLALVALGKSNKEIARELLISENTVKVHLAAAFRQLGVNNRLRAVTALRNGALHKDDDAGRIAQALAHDRGGIPRNRRSSDGLDSLLAG